MNFISFFNIIYIMYRQVVPQRHLFSTTLSHGTQHQYNVQRPIINEFSSNQAINQTRDQTESQVNILNVSETRPSGINLYQQASSQQQTKGYLFTGDVQPTIVKNQNQAKIEILERPQTAEICCRICLDSISTQTNQIITPCRCSGSMGWIHEECLKTWIVSKNRFIVGSECEICKFEYQMSFQMEKACLPSKGCKKRKGNGSGLICLFIVFSFLLALQVLVIMQIISIYDSQKDNSDQNKQQDQKSKSSNSSSNGSTVLNSPVTMIGFSIFIFFLLIPLLVFMILIVRQIFMVKRLKHWTIQARVESSRPIKVCQTLIYCKQSPQRSIRSNMEVDVQPNESNDSEQIVNDSNQEILQIRDEIVYEHPGMPQQDNRRRSQISLIAGRQDMRSIHSGQSKQSRQSMEEVLSVLNPRLQAQSSRQQNSLRILQPAPVRVFLDAHYQDEDHDIQFLS